MRNKRIWPLCFLIFKLHVKQEVLARQLHVFHPGVLIVYRGQCVLEKTSHSHL